MIEASLFPCVARQELLAREKELTRLRDELNAKRRALPWVKVEKAYAFETLEGRKTLAELFDGRSQLIVHHFMFGPGWEAGCIGCSFAADHIEGTRVHLEHHDVSLVRVSRALLAEIDAYRRRMGWRVTWVSSHGSDFNYDFHVTLDAAVAPPAYNYRSREELEARTGEPHFMSGEGHGLSVFFRLSEEVFHSYSTYARGCESLTDAYALLDRTPYGRQEDFEDSPPGWPQRPTYG